MKRNCTATVGYPAQPCKNPATGYTTGDPMQFLCDYHRDIHEKYQNGTTKDLPKLPTSENQEGVNKT